MKWFVRNIRTKAKKRNWQTLIKLPLKMKVNWSKIKEMKNFSNSLNYFYSFIDGERSKKKNDMKSFRDLPNFIFFLIIHSLIYVHTWRDSIIIFRRNVHFVSLWKLARWIIKLGKLLLRKVNMIFQMILLQWVEPGNPTFK